MYRGTSVKSLLFLSNSVASVVLIKCLYRGSTAKEPQIAVGKKSDLSSISRKIPSLSIIDIKITIFLSLVLVLNLIGRVTHICVSKQAIIGSGNVLSPGRHHAIFWTSAKILLIGTLGINFSEILSKIHISLFTKMYFAVRILFITLLTLQGFRMIYQGFRQKNNPK